MDDHVRMCFTVYSLCLAENSDLTIYFIYLMVTLQAKLHLFSNFLKEICFKKALVGPKCHQQINKANGNGGRVLFWILRRRESSCPEYKYKYKTSIEGTDQFLCSGDIVSTHRHQTQHHSTY